MEQIYQYFNIKSTNKMEIFDAINTVKGIQSWWTKGTEKHEEELYFTFNANYTKSFRITRAIQGEKVEWECIAGHEDWIGTKIEIKLIDKGESTDLSFKHFNWKEQSEHFASCNYHWGLYMKSLKSFVETGVGNPHENVKQ